MTRTYDENIWSYVTDIPGDQRTTIVTIKKWVAECKRGRLEDWNSHLEDKFWCDLRKILILTLTADRRIGIKLKAWRQYPFTMNVYSASFTKNWV